MKIIGHRGAKGLASENTLESIRQALKHNVDSIEIDLRVQGSTVVLSHDKTSSHTVYCTLTHALNEVNGKVPLIIEIKEKKVVKKLAAALAEYEGEYMLSSKQFSVLQMAKDVLPDAQIAVIERWSGVKAVAEAALLKTKQIHMNEKWLWEGLVKSIVGQGFELSAYTVNDLERAKQLEEWGVTAIFTDYPNKFK